ncbi:hypothetical protein [Microbulbifer taiwanensis]|uniref:hypothetical protein n=1 Tax=Microbulbifer taiwanensis TaxID=986746 RepID=UPI0036732E7C
MAPEKIASVTWLSANEHYRSAPLPEDIHLNRGRAEELLRLEPDLILVGQFGAQRAARRLRDLGLNVVSIPDAYSLEQLLEQLGAMEDALGQLQPLQQQKRRLEKGSPCRCRRKKPLRLYSPPTTLPTAVVYWNTSCWNTRALPISPQSGAFSSWGG